METIQLNIGGMTCASCVAHLEKTLQHIDGLDRAEVNLATEKARLRFGRCPCER